jgi:hypothetical protein
MFHFTKETPVNHLIPLSAIDRYSAAPPDSKVAAARSLHENIRDTLGSDYDTFLQGSYRNDTGVADINDVDIVAVRKSTYSGEFSPMTFSTTIPWTQIFQEVQERLEASHHYRGKTEPGDKCITVNTDFHADVVPAVKISSDGEDPIAVYSFQAGRERKNFPRVHYQNNVEKQDQTDGAYKPTVRIFKRWVRNWFAGTKVAPSFYVECLVYNVPNDRFFVDGAVSFFSVGHYIVQSVSQISYVGSVAGDKDILVNSEWEPAKFQQFRNKLDFAIGRVAMALKATSAADAQTYWREAFNE